MPSPPDHFPPRRRLHLNPGQHPGPPAYNEVHCCPDMAIPPLPGSCAARHSVPTDFPVADAQTVPHQNHPLSLLPETSVQRPPAPLDLSAYSNQPPDLFRMYTQTGSSMSHHTSSPLGSRDAQPSAAAALSPFPPQTPDHPLLHFPRNSCQTIPSTRSLLYLSQIFPMDQTAISPKSATPLQP